MRMSDWSSDVCSSDLVPPVRADAASLRRMITHLLSNAVKVSLAGAAVTLTAERGAHGGLVVVVADDGQGMTAPQIREALHPFTPEERRVGTECGSQCRSSWSPYPFKQTYNTST